MGIRTKSKGLREVLIRKGLTATSMAAVAGIGTVTALQVCNGSRSPSPRIAKKIVDSLGVEFDDVFEIVHEEASKSDEDIAHG